MEFLSYLINGISLGSIYAIIALGYTMVYGIAKMLNFAHGDVIMIGGYVAFYAMSFASGSLLGEDPSALASGLSTVVCVILAMIVCTVLGVIIEGLAYRPLRQAGSLAVLITAIGVSYFLQNAAQLLFGANPKNFTPVVSGQLTFFDGRLRISNVALLTVVACIIIMVALTTFTGKSKMGKAMRACSEDRGAAQLMGINVNRTISMTFALGGRWKRLQSRGLPGRSAAGHYRGHGSGLYLHAAVQCHFVRGADRRAAGQAVRPAGQVRARESVRWPG